MPIEYTPIATVHTPFTDPEGMPIQPSRADGAEGRVVVDEQYREGLADLAGFSHIILLCHMHRTGPHRLKVTPFLDDELRGLFATRSPRRPNPIGLSVLRLTRIDGTTLHVADVDLLDGTPVLDIKPYVNEFDHLSGVRLGWLEHALKRQRTADRRFE